MDDAITAGKKFAQLVRILETLRGDEGCPWDKEQDEYKIANFFLEEVYEAIDAILDEDSEALNEELGDVLMEIIFLAQIFKEKSKFTISDSLEKINRKMVKRHPHVFEEKKAYNSDEVIHIWNEQKKLEKGRHLSLKGLSRSSPALLSAYQIGCKVSQLKFDWPNTFGAVEKVKEELFELERAIQDSDYQGMNEEIGDLFFSLANVSRHLGINPEISLRQANQKFVERFHALEKKLKKEGKELGQVGLDELDRLWNELKKKKILS